MKTDIEIINLDEMTPAYTGYSDLVRFGDRFFRTVDAEGYYSALKEITPEEFEELKKYKRPTK